MADYEEDIKAAGAQIIYVLEETSAFAAGTADSCRNFMDGRGSDNGICIGDGQTQPVAGAFDDSPFSVYRGFDMIVDRSTMEILFSSSHGSPGGNENLSGDELLAEVQAVTGQ